LKQKSKISEAQLVDTDSVETSGEDGTAVGNWRHSEGLGAPEE
jgi:hypothetical protein